VNQSPLAPALPDTDPLMHAAAAAFRADFGRRVASLGQAPTRASLLEAAAGACRDQLLERWGRTQREDATPGPVRRVHYLSMEFLMGRALGNALAALGLDGAVRAQFAALGSRLPEVLEQEPDAALGNGGLGRLAACFLDSFAELGLPAFGYGLRYRYGMFAQRIQDGRQVESPDDWLRAGDPWDVPRHEVTYPVGFGGRVVVEGGVRRWLPAERLLAVAHDFIVPAHHGHRVATLRQWEATAADPIDFAAFCRGEIEPSARHRVAAEALHWVLYPDDTSAAGRELRLKQEAFLVSASVQDLVARHVREHGSVHTLARHNAIHLNDTHPALAPAELLRLLLDEHGLPWDEAWAITRQATSYTNHTLMPEALETWPVRLFEALLPRHLELIYEVNRRLLMEVDSRFPGEPDLPAKLSLIDEQGERRVRMAALAIAASTKVNGVSALHSELMVQTIFADHARLFPERFHNVTNGVTPRRWLMQANPALSTLVDERIGLGWRRDLDRLSELAAAADDPVFGQDLLLARRAAKERLAEHVRRELGIVVDPASLFDVQAKRIHEYKRQLLNLLQVAARYRAIVADPAADWVPRTVILAGKAASAYRNAKLIIQLAHDLGRAINSDPRVGDRLKLVFLPNYGVSLAERLLPAADLSEQISTAGTEASGTGNMKFALNGALTIGTWDGANIEMAQAIGEDHLFVFGLRAEQVAQAKALGYDPRLHAEEDLALRGALGAIAGGEFNPSEPDRYRGLVDDLLARDPYFLLADFGAYLEAQARVDALFRTPARWAAWAVRNVAGMGHFSSDRTVREYVERVWAAPPAR
jgi:starch phosphorylase